METGRRNFLKIGGLCALGFSSLRFWMRLPKRRSPNSCQSPGAHRQKMGHGDRHEEVLGKGETGLQRLRSGLPLTHNVPDIGTQKEEIKWIWDEKYENVFPGQESGMEPEEIREKSFMVLCNHCTNAPCTRVCPTKATFKSADGITLMDFHRCIGCRYCMAGCPYGARSFNFRDPRPYIKTELNTEFPTRERGVVEKCNFCEERLAAGKIPACVEACKCKALSFGDSKTRIPMFERPLRRNFRSGANPSWDRTRRLLHNLSSFSWKFSVLNLRETKNFRHFRNSQGVGYA